MMVARPGASRLEREMQAGTLGSVQNDGVNGGTDAATAGQGYGK